MKTALSSSVKFRAPSELKRRIKDLAKLRGCQESDITREAAMRFVDEEEERLSPKPKTPRAKKPRTGKAE